ncbi:MAG: hypothetical protein KDA33_10850, partial [Phycisphaerales bacterium]|nr:hypothetical protein [Phycisphaerales bacterium]
TSGAARNPSDLEFILTDIPVHVQGRIEVGDDVIAFTELVGSVRQVNYVVPSAGDTAGRGLPDNAQWDPNSFLVTGKKIVLLGGPTNDFVFTISIYDTETDAIVSIPKDDIRLEVIPVSNYAPAFMVADGNYVATMNKIGFDGVADNMRLRVIDVSGDDPVVIPFAHNPSGSDIANIDQIMVDAETHTLVAQVQQVFYVYDILNPDDAPIEFDTTPYGGVEQFDAQHTLEDGMLLYYDNTAQGGFRYWDIMDPQSEPVTIEKERLGGGRTAMIDDFYVLLANGKAIVDSLPETNPVETDPQTQDGRGVTIAIGFIGATPYAIIGSQDNANTMQFSAGGGAWTTVADPRSPNDDLEVGDVHTDTLGQFLGFKHEISGDYFLGYAVLDSQ